MKIFGQLFRLLVLVIWIGCGQLNHIAFKCIAFSYYRSHFTLSKKMKCSVNNNLILTCDFVVSCIWLYVCIWVSLTFQPWIIAFYFFYLKFFYVFVHLSIYCITKNTKKMSNKRKKYENFPRKTKDLIFFYISQTMYARMVNIF